MPTENNLYYAVAEPVYVYTNIIKPIMEDIHTLGF